MRKNNRQTTEMEQKSSKNNSGSYGTRRNGKRNPSNSRNGRKSDKENPSDSYSRNDPSWYATDPALLRDAASIPFSWAVGTPINLNSGVFDSLPSKGAFTIPGLAVMKVAPSIGRSVDGKSPVSLAANSVYAYVRYANSGHTNYDPVDLMIYLLSMTQIYSYILHLQRLYGLVTLYAQRNRYLPDTVFTALDVDIKDLRLNMANFRYGINVLINKAASLAVPGDMTIFNRMAFMYQGIYCEGESVKDQLYMYAPYSFWKFQLNSDNSGMLKSVLYDSSDYDGNLTDGWTVDALLRFGNELLDPIITSEDMNIMGGDILKAYGSNIIKVTALPTDYPIVPVYSQEVLDQFKNATVLCDDRMGNLTEVNGLDVTQDGTHSYLQFMPKLEVYGESNYASTAYRQSMRVLGEDKILTVDKVEPTPEDVMVDTRLMCTLVGPVQTGTTSTSAINGLIVGSEIPISLRYYYLNVGTNGSIVPASRAKSYAWPIIVEPTEQAEITATAADLQTMALAASFKFSPVSHIVPYKHGTTAPAVSLTDGYMFGDIDNYAILSSGDLEHLHEAALLAMFKVPSIAKF